IIRRDGQHLLNGDAAAEVRARGAEAVQHPIGHISIQRLSADLRGRGRNRDRVTYHHIDAKPDPVAHADLDPIANGIAYAHQDAHANSNFDPDSDDDLYLFRPAD
ncbi:MAG TPA: hypothetical protein PLQ56_23510, partial [Aggregatilineales bacterium]|nr:hypothetical protein [Aggregatilineales bacterium]